MSIFLGNTELAAIYHGSSQIAEVYKGSTKLWPLGGGGGAVAFEGYASATTNSTSVTCNVPTEAVDGHFLLAIVSANAWLVESDVTPPTGWTLIASNLYHPGAQARVAAYYRIADNEPASYSWTNALNMRVVATISAWSGVDGSSPVAAYSNTAYTTDDTTVQSASVTTTAANQTVINAAVVFNSGAVTFTPPTNFSEHYEAGDTTSRQWVEISSYEYASAGPTGTIDVTASISTTLKHGMAIAITNAS